MSAPRRWIEDPGAPGLERDVLRAGGDVDPPAGEQSRLWGALAAQIGAGAAGPGVAAGAGAAGAGVAGGGALAVKAVSGAAGGLGLLSFAKWAVVGALGAGALIGTGRIVTPSRSVGAVASPSVAIVVPAVPPTISHSALPSAAASPESSDSAPRALAASAPSTPLPPEPSTAELPPPAASAPPMPATLPPEPSPTPAASGTQPGSEDKISRLREESRLVAMVREALRRGNAQGASVLLEQLNRQFPEAALAQEREALAIETLARQGRRAEAQARATTFLKTWPSSVYAQTVRLYLQ